MGLGTFFNVAKVCLRDPRVLMGRKKYLFLLSHMRSYSSLLAHLLGSHVEIEGHSERLRSYTNPRDLLKTRYAEFRSNGNGGYSYLLDKILHNQFEISDQVLGMRDTRLIVFVRKPADTLRSIFRMGRDLIQDESYCDMDRNCEYYIQRLDRLVQYCKQAPAKPLYFDSELIVQQTDELLSFLTDWLELSSPLTSEYTVFPNTGASFLGDPSENIQQGQIVKPTMSTNESQDEVPRDILETANEHYNKSRQAFMAHCRSFH